MKQSTFATSRIILTGINGILIYLCSKLIKTIFQKLLLLAVAPGKVASYFLLYNQVGVEIIISIGLIYLIVKVYSRKHIVLLEKVERKWSIRLASLYLILVTADVIMQISGSFEMTDFLTNNPTFLEWVKGYKLIDSSLIHNLTLVFNKTLMLVLLVISVNRMKPEPE